jgi:hypothetical protein|tara:strand:+ start:586 stop:834 length:249 start_codon:yes stop_codon:yes gene_type:complete
LLAESTADNDATKHPKKGDYTMNNTINNKLGVITLEQLEALSKKLPNNEHLVTDLMQAHQSGDPDRVDQIQALISDNLNMEV